MPEHRELSPEEVYRACDPDQFDFETTAELSLPEGIIGQKRAATAIRFGLDITSRGYNLFLAGPPGTGRTTLIQSTLTRLAEQKPTPPDICLVNNFQAPDEPRVLYLQPGLGRQLQKDMEELIESLRQEIPRMFESKRYEQQQAEILRAYQQKTAELFSQIQREARQEGIQLQVTPAGIITQVVGEDGKPLSQEQYEALSDEEKEAIRYRIEKFNKRVSEMMDLVREAERETRQRIKDLEKQTAAIAAQSLFAYHRRKYAAHENIVHYLNEVQEHVLENITDFRRKEEEGPPIPKALRMADERSRFVEYRVNVLVDHSNTTGAPVIIETNPTYMNLFGAIEREVHFGALVTNFTMVKAGSLVRANGGYLIVEAADLFKYPYVWDTLKRAIENQEVRIEDVGVQYGIISATGLRPEPIKVKVKVILIGNPLLYHLLYLLDEDFQKLFKVKADFDSQMDRTPENERQYAQFVNACCARDHLKPFDRSGIAALVEYGSRLAEDQKKLSTRFGEIADIMTEASYWASRRQSEIVNREDVERAIEEKIYRSNRIEERIQEMIARGFILVDTDGAVVGQVNGLSVISLGDYEFGKPVRITCQTFAGRAGVINIERRAKLSGNIHNKAVMILSGYLGAKFAQDKPLTLAASLGFEQTYEMVEGDSASVAEVVALMSSLAGVPIKQNLAVTGSINQKGEVQPVGGINQKIEGFYYVCKARGLNGEHGVIIPHQNVTNLMLKKEVIEAIRNRQFHIYPVRTVDEAAELLTGLSAGQRGDDGQFEPGTLNYLVDRRLKELAEQLEKKEKGEEDENEE
ncbi:MAG: ATP-binding protein [Acidobacteria bacterium]|nr:MAG: ATP-binding protein [Acidobacteriota bacterium]